MSFAAHPLGLAQLQAKLRLVKDKELDNELKSIHKEIAAEVVKRAEPNVPVRTGKLRGSLRAAGTKKDAIGRVGKASVPYAAAVHWGYGPPFLYDAAQTIEKDITERYDSAVAGMLDRVIGRV